MEAEGNQSPRNSDSIFIVKFELFEMVILAAKKFGKNQKHPLLEAKHTGCTWMAVTV